MEFFDWIIVFLLDYCLFIGLLSFVDFVNAFHQEKEEDTSEQDDEQEDKQEANKVRGI